MKTYYELIDEREQDGFTIRAYAAPEEDGPEGHFSSGDDKADQEVLDKINAGTLAWFMVRVTASKEGIELGTDYLGGCCYTDTAEFIKNDDYYSDMRNAAIDEAKTILTKLTRGA